MAQPSALEGPVDGLLVIRLRLGDPPEARRGAPSKVVLRVDELAPARDELSAKGVRFVNEGLWSDSSIQFDILDPEGNVVQLSKE